MEDDDEYIQFVPEVIIKKEHKNHNVIVKEATFQSESEEDDDDFDPFSNEVRKPKKSKVVKKAKAPPAVVKVKPPVPPPEKQEVKQEVAPLKTEEKVNLEDDDFPDMDIPAADFSPTESESDEDENLSTVKKKIIEVQKKKVVYKYKKEPKTKNYHSRDRVKSKRYRSLATGGKHGVKRKTYNKEETTSESEDDDNDNEDDEESNEAAEIDGTCNETEGTNSKLDLGRYQRGPLITKDLNYHCMHENCKKTPIESAFEFVDHMEVSWNKILKNRK